MAQLRSDSNALPDHWKVSDGDPPPGQLETLGSDCDRADADDLMAVLVAVRRSQDRTGRGMNRVVREALWWMWEQPRLPRPLLRLKYPVSYPWSPAARAVVEHRANGLRDGLLRGLIVEHLVPATLTMSEAVRRAPSMKADELVSLLCWHGAAAVVTIADDKRLSSAGLASRMPDGWTGDVWARLRAAGLDPRSCLPISPEASLP